MTTVILSLHEFTNKVRKLYLMDTVASLALVLTMKLPLQEKDCKQSVAALDFSSEARDCPRNLQSNPLDRPSE